QAHATIGRGIQLFRLLSLVPTMHNLLEVLQSQPLLKAMLQNLEPLKNLGHADAYDCYKHFMDAYLRQPPRATRRSYIDDLQLSELFYQPRHYRNFRHTGKHLRVLSTRERRDHLPFDAAKISNRTSIRYDDSE